MIDCYEAGDALHGYRVRAEARKVRDPRVISKSGRHKARRIILTENAEAVIEKEARRGKKPTGASSGLPRPIG